MRRDQKKVKYQPRFYLRFSKNLDFLPFFWKYSPMKSHPTAIKRDKDFSCYAMKWLFFEFHLERVRMDGAIF